VYKKQLSTPFDTSTVIDVENFPIAASSGESSPYCVGWDPDGTRLFIFGSVLKTIKKYDIGGAPYNMGSATLSTDQLNLTTPFFDSFPICFRFKPDGTKLFVLGNTNPRVGEYTMSTPWNLSTATQTRVYVLGKQSSPQGMHIRDNGKLLTIVSGNKQIMQYDLDN
jgi:hypothetical protein